MSDGATHVLFEPLDFIARFSALVPKPRVNLTRFHGILRQIVNTEQRSLPTRLSKESAEHIENRMTLANNKPSLKNENQ